MSAKASYIRLDFRVSSSARISHGNQYPRVPLCLPLPSFPSSPISYSASCLLPLASRIAPRASSLRYSTTYQPSAFAIATLPFSFCVSVLIFPRPSGPAESASFPGWPHLLRSDTASRRSPSVSDKRDLEEGAVGHDRPTPPWISLRIPYVVLSL